METSPPKRRKLSQSADATMLGSATLEAAASSAGMYRPSTFILETEELLKEVKVDSSKSLAGIEELLHQVKSGVEALQGHEPVPVSKFSLLSRSYASNEADPPVLPHQIHDAVRKFENKHGIAIPFPEPRPSQDSPYKLSLETPSTFNVVGSYVLKTMVKSQGDLAVDMIVEMPKSMFQEKDFLNLRYFYKRSYFLAHVAAAVRKALPDLEISFEYMHENPLAPILCVQKISVKEGTKKRESNGSTSRSTGGPKVRVIPCAPADLFPKNKLTSTSNCIRSSAADDKKETQPPTPFYNHTVKSDSLYFAYFKTLLQTKKSSPAFLDACILGRVWLHQRGFSGSLSRGGFGHFEWALLLTLLMQGGGGRKGEAALSSSLSSHQLFKATMQFLAKSDFTSCSNRPVILGKPSDDILVDGIREPGPVLYDATRQHNFAFKMSPWSASLLRKHAKWTLDLLNDSTVDQFSPTFIMKADIPLQVFDLVVRVPCPDSVKSAGSGTRGTTFEFANRVYKIINKALSERSQLVHVQIPEQPHWSISEPAARQKTGELLVGVIFNPAEMARTVDHGPSAEDKVEARKFRQFWGERSELRRFKDGTIQETLIWKQTTSFSVCEEIIAYILNLHLKIHHDELEFHGNGFTSLIHAKPTDSMAYSAAVQAFADLEREIRGLENLPLQVRQVAPAAAELRSASLKPPQLDSPRGSYRPMDIVIYFEASGKWPDNIAAIQRTKVAFLLKIGSMLESANSSITTHVGLEDAVHEHQNLAFLDIVYDEGAVFRLRVQSDLEESLLERQTRDKTLDQHVRAESSNHLATFRRQYTHLPMLNRTVSTLCTRFPALSSTIRLAKHWFNSHKLSNHILPEAVELMVLHAFLNPAPWQTPTSATTGLLRTLLLLSKWDWRNDPLVVDPSADMGSEERKAVATRLTAWRQTLDPAMNRTVLVIATPSDATGTAFTTVNGQPFPSRVAASRMTALARSACRLVREEGVGLEPRMLFVPSTAEYDILVRLDGSVVKKVASLKDGTASKSKFKNLDPSMAQGRVPLASDPVDTLLERLSDVYGSTLVFFYGGSQDVVIGGLWNPMLARRSFRVNLPCSFKPVAQSKSTGGNKPGDGEDMESSDDEGDDLVEVNRDAILSEIARIGGDLIESIEVKKRG